MPQASVRLNARCSSFIWLPQLPSKDCVMDGPTIAFFVIGLAIVAIFLILMIAGD